MPRFSIILPVYNVAPYLRDCLDSVMGQTYPDWEAICVDDGSTDASSAILDEYAARDARIHVFHRINAGVSAARNFGLSKVSGDYVTFLDGDDAYAPNWLRTAAHEIATNEPDLLRMSFTTWTDGSDFPPINETPPAARLWRDTAARAEIWKTCLDGGWSWLLFVRVDRCDFTSWCRFPSGMRVREDNIFGLQLVSHMASFSQSSYAGYYYRGRPGSAALVSRRGSDVSRFLSELGRVAHLYPEADLRGISFNVALEILIWRGRATDDDALADVRREVSRLERDGFFVRSLLPWKWRILFTLSKFIHSHKLIDIYARRRSSL